LAEKNSRNELFKIRTFSKAGTESPDLTSRRSNLDNIPSVELASYFDKL